MELRDNTHEKEYHMILLHNENTAIAFLTRRECGLIGVDIKNGQNTGNGCILYNFLTDQKRELYIHKLCHVTGISERTQQYWFHITGIYGSYQKMLLDISDMLTEHDRKIADLEEYKYVFKLYNTDPALTVPQTEERFHITVLGIALKKESSENTNQYSERLPVDEKNDDTPLAVGLMRTLLIEFNTFDRMYQFCLAMKLQKVNVYRCQKKFYLEISAGRKKEQDDKYHKYAHIVSEYDGKIATAVRRAYILEHGERIARAWHPTKV